MRKYFAWSAVILVAAAVASLVAALPAQVSYCMVCAAEQEAHPYELRFTNHTLFARRSVRPTPFSALLEEKHLLAAHEHRWLAPQLIPDPRDLYGPPVEESLGFISAPRVVNFTRNVIDYADPSSIANWKEMVMHPEFSRVIEGSLRFALVPEAGFADRAEFLIWWGNNAYALSNRVRQLTEQD